MNRREVLQGLGIASASLILGCHAPQVAVRAAVAPGESIRAWLRDAVTVLAPAYDHVQAVAVSRRRATAAVDGLGAGVSRGQFDGAMIAVRDRSGRREQVSSDLTQVGVAKLVAALTGAAHMTPRPSFGGAPKISAPKLNGDPRVVDDRALLQRVAASEIGNSRIIYAANLLDVDDTTTWTVATDRDREQRIVRVRRIATRVAWTGSRPLVGESTLAWTGGLDDRAFTLADLRGAVTDATELMTPGGFADGERDVLLDPSVAAVLVDAMVRVRSRTWQGIEIVDDPGARGAYGGYVFDDEGADAKPVVIGGKTLVGERRPGGIGRLVVMPSHLRIASGSADPEKMLLDGFQIEGGGRVVIDPTSDRFSISAARARERAAGATTGRVFADVEVVGNLSALLASVSAASKITRSFGIREEIDDEPTWRSIETPWLRCRATVRDRRRPA